MDTIQQLKDQARALERGGQDRAALDLYSRIQQLDPEADPAVLFRLANLQQRLGQSREAVDSYVRTLEHLVRAGLRNSALAVCRRILSIAPDHEGAVLRLAELSAEAGYEQDARTAFLAYADRMGTRGEADAALVAIRSHLSSFPEDLGVRRLLIERLRAHGRVDEAVGEMRSLEALLRRRGATAEAVSVAMEIRRLAPDADWPGADEPETMALGAGDLDLLGLEPEARPPAEKPRSAGPDLDILPTMLDDAGSDPDDVSPLEGLQPTLLEGLEPSYSGMDWDAPAGGGVDDALPIMGNEPEKGAAAGDGADDLPLLDYDPVAEPDDLVLLKRRVEEAARADDPGLLVSALLGLGRRLERMDAARAREVYQRVLDLEPANQEARRALSDGSR